MTSRLTEIIIAGDARVRDQALDTLCRDWPAAKLLEECEALDRFRRKSTNLYERVRALFFLYAINRFHLPLRREAGGRGRVPFEGYAHLLSRRFEEAIDSFLEQQRR